MKKTGTWYGTVILLLSLSLVTILSGCSSKGDAAASGEAGNGKPAVLNIKIADTNTNPVFRVAADKGFFKKHNIDAEIITFASPAEG